MERWWIAVLVVPLIAGCIGQTGTTGGNATDAEPAPGTDWTLPDEITGLQLQTPIDDVQAGAGIHADGDHLYVTGQRTGFYAVDVADPTQPAVVDRLRTAAVGQTRDVAIMHAGNRTVAVLARSSNGTAFVDVTDPTNLTVLSTGFLGGGLDTDDSNGNVHNVHVVPGTTTVYVSRSVDTPGVDIVDASDPTDPKRVAVFGDLTCHDVTFWAEGDRAYCAGVRETQIWDVADPQAPELVSRIFNPAIQIHHQAIPLDDGSILAIADEFAGSTSAAYGCYGYADAGSRPVSDPVGALWFYDLSDETDPRPVSWIAPDAPVGNEPGMAPCTAHFGTQVADRPLVVVGWRTAGTWLVDYSDVEAPRFVDGFGRAVETWEARYHNGYVYTGDTARGADVLRLVGDG